MKKILTIMIFVLLSSFFINIYAYEIKSDEKIYVSGETIGIKLETGVRVMGTFGVNVDDNVITPWVNSNIKEGDMIVSYDQYEITNVKSLLKAMLNTNGKESDIVVNRNGKNISSKIIPAKKEENVYSLGLYIKDYITGVGTLTYIVPNANIYGSVGHSITEDKHYGGSIYEAEVKEIKKPTKYQAGEKRANISDNNIGNIKSNDITGVHGHISKDRKYDDEKMFLVKPKEEVKLGKAYILTSVNKDEVEKFEIEIIEVRKQETKDIKGIKFRVTDKELIKKSGGIVQGMSGSPIIQDNKIVGAVTHVTLNDAKVGYGIYIEFMFEEMGMTLQR